MSWLITATYQSDPDAAAYIAAVEAADEAASPGIGPLEPAVRLAITRFVLGCKQDGFWPVIKASCILAGARTLTGALVPLVGAAPTNFNSLFVSDDYSRKTGLNGNGVDKYLLSNRANNADPRNNKHVSVFVSSLTQKTFNPLIGTTLQDPGHTFIAYGMDNATRLRSSVNSAYADITQVLSFPSFMGVSRNTSLNWSLRSGQSNFNPSLPGPTISNTPVSDNIRIFNGIAGPSNARIAFYSIGEFLDLALLDARVTTLIQAIDAAI